MLACISNKIEVVDLLLSRADLDVNIVDIFGATSLMYASKNKEGKEVVKLLLERKDIDLDEKDQDGMTAEDFAGSEGNHEIVQVIREERTKRMGGVWTRPETVCEADCSESDDALEDQDEDDNKKESVEIHSCEVTLRNKVPNDEVLMDEDLFVKTEVLEKINEKIEKERKDLAEKEWDYMEEILQIEGNFHDEKAKIEKMLEQQIKDLETVFLEKKITLQNKFTKQKEKSESIISKLETVKVNLDMKSLLEPGGGAISELECPVCLEEMRPPVRIWQCVSGHAVCEGCRKSPLVKDCPTCRQKIVGRNILAEKLAKSLYPHVRNK